MSPPGRLELVVAHDHALFAESLAFALAHQDMRVRRVVHSPRQALAAVVDTQPTLCVTGLRFPLESADGIDVARWISQQRPETSVVLLLGAEDASVLPGALAAGVRGAAHVQQPLEELVGVLRRTAAGELAIDPRTVLPPDQSRGDDRQGSLLTPREREILGWLVQGATTDQIVAATGITWSTTRTHIQNILAKLGVHSRLEAAAYAVRHGVVPPAPASAPAVNLPSQSAHRRTGAPQG